MQVLWVCLLSACFSKCLSYLCVFNIDDIVLSNYLFHVATYLLGQLFLTCIISHYALYFTYPVLQYYVLGLLACFSIIKSVFPPFEGSRRVSLGIWPGIDLTVMLYVGLLRFYLSVSEVSTNTNPPASVFSLNIIQAASLLGISVAVIKFPDTKQRRKSLLQLPVPDHRLSKGSQMAGTRTSQLHPSHSKSRAKWVRACRSLDCSCWAQ